MLILSLDSSTVRSTVALVDQDRVLASASLGREQRHGEFLAPAIDFCLRHIGAGAGDVTGVAVGLGPGLYTGLRVGLATAKTFAAARNLPVVGLSGLDVMAFSVRNSRRPICTVLDARRKELFWAFYRTAPGGVQRETELRVGSVDKLVGEIEGAPEDVLLVGDGALAHREAFATLSADIAGPDRAFPEAAGLGMLAAPMFVREETQRPEELQALYLRQPDALIGWSQRGRLRGGTAMT